MLFLKTYRKFTTTSATITTLSDCRIFFGLKKTKLKEDEDGYNHDDLARGAIHHLLSYGEERIIELEANKTLDIEGFTPYYICGKYSINAKEFIFSVS